VNKLFILGVGRSGTSLLQSMLASHNEIAMMPETGFIRRYLVAPVFSGKQDVDIEALCADKYIQRWFDDGLLRTDFEKQKNITYSSMYKNVQKIYAKNTVGSIKYIADKDPKMIEVLPHLDELFCDYRVVHIIRDPRDVLLSKDKAEWSKKQSLIKKLIANNTQLRISEFFLRKNASRIFEIKYEDLVAKPEAVLRSVCEFLNLDFDSSMLSFQEQAEMLVSTSEMSWKKETVGPLLSQNFSKWKKEMPPTVAMLTESCCKSAMLKGRYEKLAVNVGFWNKAKNLVIISCVNVISFLYAWKAINLMKGR